MSTPDPDVDRMVNIWNAYQCMATFNLSRSASFYESGIGRGMGFRDSSQDLLGFVHMVPGRARQRLVDIASTQLPSGGAYHQYQPLPSGATTTSASGFNDDPLWLVLAVTAYVKETGDYSILHEQVPYDNVAGSEAPFYDHLRRSVALHPGAPRPARAPPHRAGGLERLPEPQLFFRHSRVRASRSPRTGREVRRSRSSSPACSPWWPRRWPGWPTAGRGWVGPSRRSRALPRGRSLHAGGYRRARLGRAVVPAGLRLLRRRRWARAAMRRGRYSSSPRACASWAGRARRRPGASRPSTVSGPGWPRRTASSSTTRRTPATTSSWARSRRTRRATRKTAASFATPTRG